MKKCQTAMFVKEIDISQLMTYDKQIEGEKLKEKKKRI